MTNFRDYFTCFFPSSLACLTECFFLIVVFLFRKKASKIFDVSHVITENYLILYNYLPV